jgi:hypothetical protein
VRPADHAKLSISLLKAAFTRRPEVIYITPGRFLIFIAADVLLWWGWRNKAAPAMKESGKVSHV